MTLKMRVAFWMGLALWGMAMPLQGWPGSLTKSDEAFLDQVEHKAFDFFWNEADPRTGLIPDGTHTGKTCSIASVGFGLTALCVAESRKWITHEQAYEQALLTLKSFQAESARPDSARVEGKFGLFYHFVDATTGRWEFPKDCVSTADSALLLCGVITCGEYFKGTEVEKIADQIYRACQWDAFMKDDDGKANDFIAMGYIPPDRPTPNRGYVGRYYGYSDNSFLIYLLGIASPTHGIPVSAWQACQSTYKRQSYLGEELLATSPPGLAFHFYPHCWLDLRWRKDQVGNYFENTVKVISAQQAYCRDVAKYPAGLWGLSSCISAKGYEAFGAPLGEIHEDGTITPHALAGSLPFAPEAALKALNYLYHKQHKAVWGKYGFTDAVNIKTGWSTPDVLGLDEGPIVLMIENYRTGLIWKTFSRNQHIQNALKKIGFMGIVEDFENGFPISDASQYHLVEGEARLSQDTASKAEGRRALKISGAGSKVWTMEIKPNLKDFRNYAYLALWSRNLRISKVEIGSAGKLRRLEPGPKFKCGTWTQEYFLLPEAQVELLSRVEDVRIQGAAIHPGDPEGSGLDGVVLAYATPPEVPQPPSQVQASLPRHNGIIQVSFTPPQAAYQYEVHFSSKPLKSLEDLDGPSVSSRVISAWPPEARQEVFQTVTSPGTYFFAVQTLDAQGLRSAPVFTSPVTVAHPVAEETITRFDPGVPLDWSVDGGIRLNVIDKPGTKGGKALKVQFDKKSDWDYFALNLDQPLDVRPYRYLKVQVYGCERMIAKLYTTLTLQADIGTLTAEKPDQWNELNFDLSAMSNRQVDKKQIHKLLFFPAPGQKKTGEIYLGDVWLSQ